MKKIIYILMVLGVTFTSCDPMDDIYDDIDAQNEVISGEIEFTLSDDDYEELDLSYGNFNSVDDAKSMIPGLLEDKYPAWGEGSLATVTFKIYAPKKTEKSLIVYTVSSEDYDTLGFTYGNFSSMDEIVTFLDWKYPDPADRVLVSLTYEYYSGGVSTLNNGFLYLNGAWEFIQGFTADEYNTMGESYPNFSNQDEAESKIPIFLKEKFKYDTKKAGDIEAIMYKLYTTDVDDLDGDGKTDDSATYSYVSYYIFDGENWSLYDNIINETVKFGHDGSTWVPDNTIKYTLTQADYELVGNGYYGNFDVRSGKAEESVDVRLEKINTILLNNFPNMEEGQKFVVSYNVYSGANEVWEMKVILEAGAYVLN
ncbi:hypothetical protein [Lutibacter sp. B1]|uniref:hypothetical protein n=1 Tax=Lutibacter sp. B1 TaxID=2725996 RepID=UPI0014571DCE|nr:hypothetical protein [Lutibacter sp. B1]NLP57608.1 hypothetical protein [Lutibacter sp. B1]